MYLPSCVGNETRNDAEQQARGVPATPIPWLLETRCVSYRAEERNHQIRLKYIDGTTFNRKGRRCTNVPLRPPDACMRH